MFFTIYRLILKSFKKSNTYLKNPDTYHIKVPINECRLSQIV